MKKLVYLSMVLLGMAVILSSCGSGGGSTPADAASHIMKLMQKGDYEGVVDHMQLQVKEGEDIKAQKEMLVALMEEKAGKSMDEKGGLESYEVLEETISEDGNSASVKVKSIYGNGSEETQDMDFVKEDGKWLMEMNK
ncbi:MAG: DUF4878 domain-containing protein [Bacteroidales bacterium]|nr:DUF4878 domain-containing protein [Bacteroidales bacterium]MCF8387550.1 DUF4878 domain-containing protein [Bacteroidales bacterium]MCF8399590.1 DUF4878 domain-containing protein [Bacteroidales bacterium]